MRAISNHVAMRLASAAGSMLVGLALVMALAPGASQAQQSEVVGFTMSYSAETPHPYAEGDPPASPVWTDTVYSGGATFVRVHFKRLDLAPGDYVTVSSLDGSQSWTYRDMGPHGTGDVWSFATEGDTAIVTLYSGSGSGWGYEIDQIGHGTEQLQSDPQSIGPPTGCLTDGRENVACHLPEIEAAQRPVARTVTITNQGLILRCTGWLASSSTPDLLVTNNHCVSSNSAVQSTQVTFNFQFTDCAGTQAASTTDYVGDQLIKTNKFEVSNGGKGGLDYTLMTLLGNPEAVWGELIPSPEPASVGELIWIVQHGGGAEKQVAYYEEVDGVALCDVDEVDQTYLPSAPGSQTGYSCETAHGSSGSPVVLAATGHVIALHHLGQVATCLNGGTDMADICADAGTLLNCGGGCTPLGASCTSNNECCSNQCSGSGNDKTCNQAVPEPSTTVLGLVGWAWLLVLHRWKTHRQGRSRRGSSRAPGGGSGARRSKRVSGRSGFTTPATPSRAWPWCPGKSVRWVADQLRHSNPELTLRVYAHALREEETDLSFLDFGSTRRHPRGTERRVATATRKPPRATSQRGLVILERETGFEPATLSLGS